MAQALVPLKDLVRAKTRLAGLMSPSERRALAQAMAEDVLSVLASHPQLERVTVVSDDPSAAMLAMSQGVEYLEEAALGVSGLNPVVEAATGQLGGTADDLLIVLHADLPMLKPRDIAAVIDCHGASGGLIIGCDSHRRGSNLLAFGADERPRFCFGRDSYAAHRDMARAAGIGVTTIFRPGIALDVDEAMDVVQLMRELAQAGEHTRALLGETELGRRLALALGALVAGDQDLLGSSNARE